MTSAEQAASAATTLRKRLTMLNVVQQVDIATDFDDSHFIRVWVTHRTREVLAHVPTEIEGVPVQIASI